MQGDTAYLDIGSMSVRMLYYKDGTRCVAVRITRLAQGMTKGKLSPVSVRRTLSAVAHFVGWAKAHGMQCSAYATSAVRDATNKKVFTMLVKRWFNVDLLVLSEEQEASFSFAGAAGGYDGNLCVLDIGGRSTEISAGSAGVCRSSHSIPIGAVNLSEQKLDAKSMRKVAKERFDSFVQDIDTHCLVRGVGGTITNLVAIQQSLVPYDPAQVHGFVLTKQMVTHWRDQLSHRSIEQCKEIPGMHKERAGYMLAGCCILLGCMDAMGIEEIEACTHDGLDAFVRQREVVVQT